MANIKISELNPLLTVEDADVLPIVDNAVTKKVTAAILRTYTEGNSVLLTGAQTVAGIKTFTAQLASTVATGTAPFSVASTTKVTNLNADLLDGLSSADFQATLSGTGIVKSTAGTISYLTDNSTNWNTAFNDKINSAAVTGSGTNTLTLTQQDAGTITATWVNGTLIREIRNNTGATLTKGTIVYISGATGNKPTVSKAIATGDSTSAQTFGFVQENIANNANGYVVVIGDLTGVDTSAFTEGDQLYLSATVAGAFTATKQYAPNHLVYVGIVTRSHPTLGQIEVNIQNGYEMDELHNVAAQSPSNGDILQYVTSTGLWTKIAGSTTNISEGTNLYFTNARSRSAISLTTTGTSGAATYNSSTGVLNVPNYADTDTGITSLNGLTALTQTFAVGTSGTDFGISSATSTHTFNLPTASAANRGALSSADWTTFNNKQNALTNPITGTGTTNYLPKFTGASALGNSLIFDNGTNVGINTIRFDWFAYGNFGGGSISQKSAVFAGNSYVGSQAGTNISGINFGVNNTTDSPTIISRILGVTTSTTNNAEAGYLAFYTKTGSTSIASQEQMRLDASGQLLIGTSTSSTFKLDVSSGSVGAASGRFKYGIVNNRDFQGYNNGIIFQTAGTSNWYIGSSANGSNTEMQIFNSALSAVVLNFSNATGAATFSSGISVSGATAPASGIQFPPTQVASASANNLDDYEEGTWTMGISFGGASVGVTYSANSATYTKVGRQVTVNGYMGLSSKGTSIGAVKITGLPFANGASVPFYSTPSLFLASVTFTNVYSGFSENGTTNILLKQITSLGVSTNLTDTNIANNSEFIVSFTYFV